MAYLPNEELQLMHQYWQAANYLAAGQIYLQANPLLKEPLRPEHIKPRLLGHWGTSPGLNIIYVHLNRLIRNTGARILYVAGPGHGAPAVLANTYLEGTYSEVYPEITMDEKGMELFFRQFSTPGGIPSHVSPHTPGSIHEGGELGYSLLHATGAVFDNPGLIAACVIGDGEAETGPLAGSWKSIRFLHPVRDGAVLPILHLNGYKISGPTVLSRMSDESLSLFFEGQGYEAFFVEGIDPMPVHRSLARALDQAYERILSIRAGVNRTDTQKKKEEKKLSTSLSADSEPETGLRGGRTDEQETKQDKNSSAAAASGIEPGTGLRGGRWPVIVLRTPKGWTGPREWKGKPIEGTFRAHQVPLTDVKKDPGQLKLLEQWLRSYEPEKLFDASGRLLPELAALAPTGNRRMGALPYANGGYDVLPLQLPDPQRYAVNVFSPGQTEAENMRNFGEYFRDVFRLNEAAANVRLFCPDETSSNRLDAVFEATDRCFTGTIRPGDEHVSPTGRVMEVLSEHLCQGWLEGYLLTGRHGIFPCYEAFVTIVDSMFSQHAKWLKICRELPWRRSLPSLNYLLTSHSWRQDHNGYSHQGPGFIDTVVNKKSEVIRIYFPPDANCLLAVMDHCLRTKDYVNLVVAGKQPALQWLNMEQAVAHCSAGASVWEWAGNDGGKEPDVVLACAGDVPTLETMAAAWELRKHMPSMKLRVVNLMDLMSLSPQPHHPHSLPDDQFREMFTEKAPVIFAFHGYVRIIHDLVHGRPEPERFHVRGFMEEGTTTTPFDMVVLNNMSRYQLAMEAIRRVPKLQNEGTPAMEYFKQQLEKHHAYIRRYFEDMPEIRNWKWSVPAF